MFQLREMSQRAHTFRNLLKELLNGKHSPDKLLNYIQQEREDASLLSQAERQALNDYHKRYAGNAFETFSLEEILLYALIRFKARRDAPRRHLLDQLDLTTVPGEELEAAAVQPWEHEPEEVEEYDTEF